MKQYLQLIETILATGTWQGNRTGIRTIRIPGASMRFDLLRDGFPAITTRRLPFKAAAGELVGFLRGYRSAADFRALGCKVWDQNANENAQWLANPYRLGPDYLGEIYGYQWRNWPAYKLLDVDDAAQIVDATAHGYRAIGQVAEEGRTKVAAAQGDRSGSSMPGHHHRQPGGSTNSVPCVELRPARSNGAAALPSAVSVHAERRDARTVALPVRPVERHGSRRAVQRVRGSDDGVACRPADRVRRRAGSRISSATPTSTKTSSTCSASSSRVSRCRRRGSRSRIGFPHSRKQDDMNRSGWIASSRADFMLENYRHHPPLTAPMAI